jgi:hypothetical protein
MAGLGGGLAVAAGFVALMAGMSWWAAQALPVDGPVAIHFDWKGQADGFGSRWLVLAVVPVAYAALCAIMIAVLPGSMAGGGTPAYRAVLVPGLISVPSHALVLWLVVRWAQAQ